MHKRVCPVCQKYVFETESPDGEWDCCPVCGWTEDPLESRNWDYSGGYNGISVVEARKKFASGKKVWEE